MNKVFYEKVGKRYKPVREYDSTLMDAMPKGTHIIMCYPGGQSTRYSIDPALAPLIAAGRVAEDAISNAIHKASELRPARSYNITPEQRKLFDAFLASMPADDYQRNMMTYGSIRDAAEAGVKAMIDEANKLLENPAVKKAYEHFLLVAELTKGETHDTNS
jgi:hypothetical protein